MIRLAIPLVILGLMLAALANTKERGITPEVSEVVLAHTQTEQVMADAMREMAIAMGKMADANKAQSQAAMVSSATGTVTQAQMFVMFLLLFAAIAFIAGPKPKKGG